MSDTDNKEVVLQEVGPRDGLQNEPRILSVEDRVRLVEELSEAGLGRIQIGSFVNPKLVPQMARTEVLWRMLRKKPGVRYSVLVLNQKGLDRAIAEGIPHVEIYVSASETHSMKNSGTSVSQALESAITMIESAAGKGIGVTAGVMCAFGCFYEGTVSIGKVLSILAEFQTKNPSEFGLADTSGMADPDSVRALIQAAGQELPLERITLHLHDTRGLGIKNMIAALELGFRHFDTSIGGLGGCPFIPGAVGNISTERSLEALHSMGFESGINLQEIVSISEKLTTSLGRPTGAL